MRNTLLTTSIALFIASPNNFQAGIGAFAHNVNSSARPEIISIFHQ